MIDIICAGGKAVIKGTGDAMEIMARFACVAAAVYDAEIKCGLPDTVAKQMMKRALEIGIKEGENIGAVGIIVPMKKEKE